DVTARMPDISLQVDAAAGVADVLEHPLEYLLRSAEHFQVTIVERTYAHLGIHQPIDGKTQLTPRQRSCVTLKLGRQIIEIGFQHLSGPGGALSSQVEFAEQDVQDCSDEGNDIDDQQPRQRDADRPPSCNDANGDRCDDQPVEARVDPTDDTVQIFHRNLLYRVIGSCPALAGRQVCLPVWPGCPEIARAGTCCCLFPFPAPELHISPVVAWPATVETESGTDAGDIKFPDAPRSIPVPRSGRDGAPLLPTSRTGEPETPRRRVLCVCRRSAGYSPAHHLVMLDRELDHHCIIDDRCSGRNIVQSKAPGLEVDVESIESDSSRQVFQRAAAGCTGKQPINGIFYQQKALARIDGAQATGKAG